ncbi:ergosterol biosynthetic protein 28 homolog isoform X1 [Mirounga angustirostris]|uniref:ergosterol biosynthetic protein 28 homolog isoform X1 n=1 Tax=Mirounga leonina TaxID=9715 RepID=UPI00156BF0DE|nr:ergosterol biosynthetic protein 28 homolog isoform X1 [Mirounga leonina]XP_045757237.1 ergosterol biosynthetic protein 28 homolog isoform X1 [Mirounga angustirostris]
MSRFLNVLRSWLVMVSIIAIGNTLQSFRDHTFLYEKLYTGKPDLVNGLQARTFGIWTLLSSVIRCLCAIDIHNKTYAVPHHTLDLPPRPGALPFRVVCLWDRSSHDWRPGSPDGGKFLNPGYASWAPVPRSRTSIQTEEEKLKLALPPPRLRLPPLPSPSFILPPLLFLLFCTILSPLTTASLLGLGFFLHLKIFKI